MSGSVDQFTDLLRGFGALPTAIVADCLNRLRGTSNLRPFHRSSRLCGVAYTVRVAAGDNLFIHHALNICNPGDIVVVEGGGDTTRALIGELMLLFGQSRGVSGFVIDGAIRDAEAFRSHDFPCFARGQTMRGPYKNGPGAVQVPVSIDGMIVNPGDIIIGDEDGVLAISPADADILLAASKRKLASEERTKLEISSGNSDRSWVDKIISSL